MFNYSNDQFIEQIVIPYCTGAIEKNFAASVFDLNGKIIIATNLYARFWGYESWKDLKNKRLQEVYPNLEYSELMQQISEIRQKVINLKKIFTHINFLRFPWGVGMAMAYHFPIVNPSNGEVVATRSILKKVNMLKTSLEINHFMKNIALKNDDKKGNGGILTNRQREILFLLVVGFSQEEAAEYLGISRGTLANVVSEYICPVFGISGSNTKLLIKAALDSHYFKDMPDKLFGYKIIEVDNHFDLEKILSQD